MTLLRGMALNVRWQKGKNNQFVVSTGLSIEDRKSLLKSGLVSAREPEFAQINERITTIRHDLMEAERALVAGNHEVSKASMKLAYNRRQEEKLMQQEKERKREVRVRNMAQVQDAAYRSDLITIETLERQLEACRQRVAGHRKQYGLADPDELLTKYFDKFIEAKTVSQIHRPATIKSYRLVRSHVEAWKPELRLDETTNLQLGEFEVYLLKKGSANPTVRLYMHRLKTMLNWCTEQHYPVNPTYSSYRVKLKIITNPVLYCSREDIQALLLLERPALTRHQCFIRDVFLLACGTGLRFSDLIRLGPQHIREDRIEIVSQKTNMTCTITITPLVDQMLRRLGGDLAQFRFHDDSFNVSLRLVLKELPSWQKLVEVTKMTGKVVTIRTVPRWKLAGSHCGRRTFINLAGQAKISGARLMAMTGHATQTMLNKYIRHQDAPAGAFEHAFTFNIPGNEPTAG